NFIIFLIITGFISCGSISGNGKLSSEKRDISGVHTIKTSGSIDVEIISGDNYNLIVEDDENLIKYVVTDIDDGVLNIHYKNGYSIRDGNGKVTVTVPSLNNVSTSGSADI